MKRSGLAIQSRGCLQTTLLWRYLGVIVAGGGPLIAANGPQILLPSSGASEEHFGSCVDMHDDVAVVGASGSTQGQYTTGAAYIY